jgi:lipopolysaccharide assembly protein B|tara:strand:+ start:4831 stop:5991 length:1161 start_codon:yes stop_codon:yes gene_type:complete
MPSESFFYLTGIFLFFGMLGYIYFNFFEQDDKNNINPDYLKGLKYLLDEESDKAINLFSDLIEIDDETIQTHLALGVLFRKQGRVDKAIQLHEYILSKEDLPENHYFQTLFELGENYFSAGIYNKAEEIFIKLKGHDDHSEAALNKLIKINEYYGEWKKALSFLEELDVISNQDLSVSRNHYYCEIAEMHIENDDIQSANNYLLKAQGLHTDSIRSEYIKMLIDLKNLKKDSAIKSFVTMVNKNKIAYILALPKIIQSSNKIDTETVDLKLRELLNNDPESQNYLAIVGVMFPEIKNDVVEEVIQYFIENQDIVREIDKLDNDYSIVSTISNHLSQSMRLILNKKMEDEYKYNCKKCGYQTISFSWQCPTCKSWESSLPINFLKAI